jgi:hypothetical protein
MLPHFLRDIYLDTENNTPETHAGTEEWVLLAFANDGASAAAGAAAAAAAGAEGATEGDKKKDERPTSAKAEGGESGKADGASAVGGEGGFVEARPFWYNKRTTAAVWDKPQAVIDHEDDVPHISEYLTYEFKRSDPEAVGEMSYHDFWRMIRDLQLKLPDDHVFKLQKVGRLCV